MDLNQLNKTINELQNKRTKILDAEYKLKEEEFLKLNWLKDIKYLYFYETYGAYGRTEYQLRGGPCFIGINLHKPITLVEKSKNYQDNIIIDHKFTDLLSNHNFVIRTCDAYLLGEFITKHNLKVDIPTDLLSRLSLYEILYAHRS